MTRFLSPEATRLDPYTPGEQPQDQQYLKLNTNESPFPPSARVLEAISREEVSRLNLYPDPACTPLRKALAERYELPAEQIIVGNGSDEILAFAFRAFCGEGIPAAFADITYGFYRSQTALFGLDTEMIPLRDNFRLDVEDYMDFPGVIFIANPNAPTGIALPPSQIERLLYANRNRVVVVDEAYIDFGAESCVPLIEDYDNLLVTQTMSKSRSLAGGRIGYALGSEDLISALNRVKFSFHPYSVNRLSMLAGIAAVEDNARLVINSDKIQENRAWTAAGLDALGFKILPSKANFLFAASESLPGEILYRKLKERGILVRWFDSPRIRDYVRITIGSRDQMKTLLVAITQLLHEQEQAENNAKVRERRKRS